MYHTMKELFPGSSYREWLSSFCPGWTAFNPSIAFSEMEGYKAIIRSSNYLMDHEGYYHMTSPDGVIRTQNYLATLDSELNIVDLNLLRANWGEPIYPLVVGLEDARLHWHTKRWEVYGTLRQHNWEGICGIGTGHIEGDQIANPSGIFTDPKRHEKKLDGFNGDR